jgi:hypothetical protein
MVGIIGALNMVLSDNGLVALIGLMGTMYMSMILFVTIAPLFAAAMAVMAIGVGYFAVAIAGLALALRLLPEEVLSSISALAKGLAEFDGAKVEGSFAAMSSFVNELDNKSDNVKPMLTNLAVMTTGVSAETGAAGVIGAAVVGLSKAVSDLGNKGKEMVVKLDGEATAKLMRGEAVKVMVGQNVQYS